MDEIETAKRLFFDGLGFLDAHDFINAELQFREALKLAPTSVPILSNLAAVLFAQDKLTESLEFSKQAIAKDGKNIEAHLNIVNCSVKKRNYAEVLISCDKIIAIEPNNFEAHNNRGLALANLGRLAEALEDYEHAIALNSKSSELYNNRGNALRNLSRYAEALESYEQAIKCKPEFADAWVGKGNVFLELKRYDEAVIAYDKALALQPDLATAWVGRGSLLVELNRYEDASAAYDRALALMPDMGEAWLGLGNMYLRKYEFDKSDAAYDKALTLKPNLAGAWVGRGNLLVEKNRYDEAAAAYDRALALKPDMGEAWLGRGNMFIRSDKFDEAGAAYTKALTLSPDLAPAWVGRGNVFSGLKHDDEAFFCYGKAIDLKRDYADAYFHMSLVKLSLDEFKEGWELYEWRTRAESVPIRERLSDAAIEALGISTLNTRNKIIGKDIAVVAEQGVGDEIMFASMLPDILNDVRSITYQLDPRLIRIASRSFPVVSFVPRTQPNYILSQKFDTLIRAGSFGHIYRPDKTSFPRTQYLKANASIINHWRSALGSDGEALRIGISWRGGTAKTGRDQRSLTLDQLRPLLTRDDCMFVSLQYGDVRDEVEKYNENASRKIMYFPKDAIDDFDDLAGLIEALDIVVSVQNAVVHQCGALGKTCLAMLPRKAEWRYGRSGSQMTWYSSVELFRQSESGSWGDVLAAINSRLTAAMLKARGGAK